MYQTFIAGPPCPPFSDAGKGLGDKVIFVFVLGIFCLIIFFKLIKIITG